MVVDRSVAFAGGLAAVLLDEGLATAVERVDSAISLAAYLARARAALVIISLEPFHEALKVATVPTCAHVLIMSSGVSQQDITDARRAGVTGLLRKDATLAQISRAARHVAEGGTAFGTAWGGFRTSSAILDEVALPTNSQVLTGREQQVVRLVLEGCSNRRAARHLGVAEQTAKNHLHSAMAKLGVASRTQLYRWALDHEIGSEVAVNQ